MAPVKSLSNTLTHRDLRVVLVDVFYSPAEDFGVRFQDFFRLASVGVAMNMEVRESFGGAGCEGLGSREWHLRASFFKLAKEGEREHPATLLGFPSNNTRSARQRIYLLLSISLSSTAATSMPSAPIDSTDESDETHP